jgi:periplasmic protein TonB
MKNILVFCISLLGFTSVYSQSTQPANAPDKIYTLVQQKPQFPGDINKFLSDNIKYPEDARKNSVQGTVYVQFVVEKDGSVSGVKVLRGVQGGASLESEAVQVVSEMPKWAPGMQNGSPVRVSYLLPVRFML